MMTDKETPSSGGERMGVLRPLLQYRFRVLFGDEGMNDLFTELTQHVVYCKMDMKNKTLNIRLRQPIISGVFHMIELFIRHRKYIFVEPMNGGNDAAICTLQFNNCECTKHSADFDYAEGGILFHDLEFSYDRMDEFQPVDWEARKAEAA